MAAASVKVPRQPLLASRGTSISENSTGRRVRDPNLAVDDERAELVASFLMPRAVIKPSVLRGRLAELIDERLRLTAHRRERSLDAECVGNADLRAPHDESR